MSGREVSVSGREMSVRQGGECVRQGGECAHIECLSCPLLQVWKNGIVTLGVETLAHVVATPPASLLSAQSEFLVAPLWFDQTGMKLRPTVMYEEHSSQPNQTPSKLLRNASHTVGNLSTINFGAALDFQPTWALLVDWRLEVAEDLEAICANTNYSQEFREEFYFFLCEREFDIPDVS